MEIWHSGVGPSPDAIDGIAQTVWALGEAQAAAGHQVTFLATGGPGQASEASARGIHLSDVADVVGGRGPDVIHMHSVFIPAQARLGAWASRNRVPYVISPHGGLSAAGLRRGATKKELYALLVERRRFRSASAVLPLTPGEAAEVRAFTRGRHPPLLCVPNAVRSPTSATSRTMTEDAVFMGRLDAVHKGLDRFAALAGAMPDLTFGIYGTHATGDLPVFPDNVTLHAPVHGDHKWAVLASARLYLQPSRWEGFPLAVCEAALMGTPLVLSTDMHFAHLIEGPGVLVVDFRSPLSCQVAQVRRFLRRMAGDEEGVSLRSAMAELVRPEAVAARIDEVYQSVIA